MQRAINVWAAIALAGVVVVIVAFGVLWHGGSAPTRSHRTSRLERCSLVGDARIRSARQRGRLEMVAYVRHLPKLTPVEQQHVLHQYGEPMDHGDSSHEHFTLR